MRIFVSSTSLDLEQPRAVAAEVIRDAQAEAVVMEHFPADPKPIVDLCKEALAGCDLVILLVAHRRGWVPKVEQGGDGSRSITAFEVDTADRLGKPVLCFLADDDWPGRLWETDDAGREWVRQFRGGLNRNARFFAWENNPGWPALRALLTQQLANFMRPRPAAGAPPPTTTLRKVPLPPWPEEPYPLLGPYLHPGTFGGRDADIDRLVQLVHKPPLVLCLHAASGAGKSSLLLAGLAPRLRDEGHAVSVERAPGDPGTATRMLADLFDPPPALPDGDVRASADAFARAVRDGHLASGRPVVLVLDQFDDMVRNDATRQRALAQLGPLLAATAQRVAGSQSYPCKWVLCYRHEFHGSVRAWLEDVLAQARAVHGPAVDAWPHDLSDAQKSHDWAVPLMGKPPPGADGEARVRAAFREAVRKPLALQLADGTPRFRYAIDEEGADRLAGCFARARLAQPEAPLVPELQVVLNHLLQKAAQDGSPALVTVAVPGDEELEAELRHALARHLERALGTLYPATTDTGPTRVARTRALLAMRQLADAEGRRSEGVPVEEFQRRLGADGPKVLAALSSPLARLVVVNAGRCTLSHDRLAEVVAELVRNEAARGNLAFDGPLIDLQRIVAQKVELYLSDPGDESALALSRAQRGLVQRNSDTLLFDEDRRAWWSAQERRRRGQLQRQAFGGAALVVAIAAVLTAWLPPHAVVLTTELPLPNASWTVHDGVAVSATPGGGVVHWRIGDTWAPKPVGAGAFVDIMASPTGRHVAGVDAEGGLKVWRTDAPAAPTLPLIGGLVSNSRGVPRRAMTFSPDGRLIAVCSPQGEVRLWPVEAPDQASAARVVLEVPEIGYVPSPPLMKFSARGSWLLVGTIGGEVWLVDTTFSKPRRLLGKVRFSIGGISEMPVLSKDERWAVWTSPTPETGANPPAPSPLQVLDLQRETAAPLTLQFGQAFGEGRPSIRRLLNDSLVAAFSADAGWLVARVIDSPFNVWQRQGETFGEGRRAAGVNRTPSGLGMPPRFGPDGWVLTRYHGRYELWRLDDPQGSRKVLFEETLRENTMPVAIAFRPDGRQAAAVGPDGALHQWVLGEALDVRKPLAELTGWPALRWANDGRHLYAMDQRKLLLGPTGRPLEPAVSSRGSLQTATLSGDRRTLYAFTRDGVVAATRHQVFWGLRLWALEWPAFAGTLGAKDAD